MLIVKTYSDFKNNIILTCLNYVVSLLTDRTEFFTVLNKLVYCVPVIHGLLKFAAKDGIVAMSYQRHNSCKQRLENKITMLKNEN